MRIVDPTSGVPPEETATVDTVSESPSGSLCGLSNSKPGAHDLLEAIGRHLADRHGLGPNGLEAKPSAAVGADPALLDHLAAQYRLAVVAIGD